MFQTKIQNFKKYIKTKEKLQKADYKSINKSVFYVITTQKIKTFILVKIKI